MSNAVVVLGFELGMAHDEHRYPVSYINTRDAKIKRGSLPADHSGGKRTRLPHCIDSASHVDHFLYSIDMHFANLDIALAILRGVKY